MKFRATAALLGLGLVIASHAEAQGWKRTLAPGMLVDELEAMADGIALTGGDPSSLSRLVVRLDATGNVRWSREIGLNNSHQGPMSATPDGGLVVAGAIDHPGSFRTAAVLLKLDDDGAIVWQRQWGSAPNSFDARDVITLADGSFVVAGSGFLDGTTDTPGWLARFDANGNLLSWRLYGMGVGHFTSLIATSDGGLLTVGRRTGASPESDVGVLKLDASGAVQWERQIAGTNPTLQAADGVQTPDGGFVIVGIGSMFNSPSTSWVLKLDDQGNLLWSRFLDTSTGFFRTAGDVVALPDGSLVFRESRYTADPPGPIPASRDGRLWKLDASGNPTEFVALLFGSPLVRKGTELFTTEWNAIPATNAIVKFDASALGGCLGPTSAPPPTTVPVLTSTATVPFPSSLLAAAVPSAVGIQAEAMSAPLTCGAPPLIDSPGLYDSAASAFHLRNALSSGGADASVEYGPGAAGWKPVVGDWNGDGIDTPGLYDEAGGTFYLRNSNTSGYADIVVAFGPPGAPWIPIAGDWDGNGSVTIGLYDPANALWYLRNSLTSGVADITFAYGPGGAGWIPVVGRWSAANAGSIVGLYDPAGSTFYLAGSNATGFAAITAGFGPAGAGWLPVVGDWDGDGVTSIGLFDPAMARWFTRNANTSGFADAIFDFGAANAGWIPLAGDWNGR